MEGLHDHPRGRPRHPAAAPLARLDAGPGGLEQAVRHPGYLGLVLWALASPFLLLSARALFPAALAAAWVVMRTALEDALLRRELPGYAEYARRVRFRLVPGAW